MAKILTETRLKQMIKEAVYTVLSEVTNQPPQVDSGMTPGQQALQQLFQEPQDTTIQQVNQSQPNQVSRPNHQGHQVNNSQPQPRMSRPNQGNNYIPPQPNQVRQPSRSERLQQLVQQQVKRKRQQEIQRQQLQRQIYHGPIGQARVQHIQNQMPYAALNEDEVQ